jgi:hypothetical protein
MEGFGQELQGAGAELQAPPPRTPEEQQQRVSGWTQVVQRMQQDPALQMSIMRMGLQMMQPQQPGQTTGGHIASALGGSVDWLASNRALQDQFAKQEAERARIAAETEGAQARTQMTRAQTQNVPLEGQRLQADIGRIGADTGRITADTRRTTAETDAIPNRERRADESLRLQRQNIESEIKERTGRGELTAAQAALARARALVAPQLVAAELAAARAGSRNMQLEVLQSVGGAMGRVQAAIAAGQEPAPGDAGIVEAYMGRGASRVAFNTKPGTMEHYNVFARDVWPKLAEAQELIPVNRRMTPQQQYQALYGTAPPAGAATPTDNPNPAPMAVDPEAVRANRALSREWLLKNPNHPHAAEVRRALEGR